LKNIFGFGFGFFSLLFLLLGRRESKRRKQGVKQQLALREREESKRIGAKKRSEKRTSGDKPAGTGNGPSFFPLACNCRGKKKVQTAKSAIEQAKE
jgi:hypothetical protein